MRIERVIKLQINTVRAWSARGVRGRAKLLEKVGLIELRLQQCRLAELARDEPNNLNEISRG